MKIVLVLLTYWIGLGEGAKILAFFPLSIKSHHGFFMPLLREMANRGHQITMVTSIKVDDPPPNYQQIIIKNYMEELWENPKYEVRAPQIKWNMITPILMEHAVYNYQRELCHDPQVRRLIDSEDLSFDIIFLESYFMQEIFAAFGHKFRAPTVQIMTFGEYSAAYRHIGNPFNPSYEVHAWGRSSDEMSLFERVSNTLLTASSFIGGNLYLPVYQRLMDSCFNYTGWESRPSLGTLLSDAALIIQNSHYSLNYPHPLLPTVINAAGMHLRPLKPLPQDLQKFMDGAKDGVILFSLGSLVNASRVLEGDKLAAFLNVFSRLKQKVLWKWEIDMAEKPENVFISKWLPQQEILAHENCKLFLTHGGYGSLVEAVVYQVPILGIPFVGDQEKNLQHAVKYGYGLQLDYDLISEEYIYESIMNVLNNPAYKDAIVRRSKLFNDRPQSPLETAVYWVEYVLKYNGAKDLRPAVLQLHWWQSSLIDVFIVIAIPIILFIVFVFYTSRKIYLFFSSAKPSSSHETVKSKKKN